jgi:hypothetical protein
MFGKKLSLGNSSLDDNVLPIFTRKNSPKTYSAFTCICLQEARFRRHTVPSISAHQRMRGGTQWRQHKVLEEHCHICGVQANVHVQVYIVRFGKIMGRIPCLSRYSHDPENPDRNDRVNTSVNDLINNTINFLNRKI